MSVVEGDIRHRHSVNHPSNDVDLVGGAKTSTDIGDTIGELFHAHVANPDEDDPSVYQYKKSFITNTNATDSLTGVKVWIKNALDDLASGGVVSAASSSGQDDTDVKIKVVGEDLSSNVQVEEIVLNGTTEVSGALTFAKVFWIELREVASGSLINAVGDITIEAGGTEIGIIPAGISSAVGHVEIGVVGTLDDSGTAANALTAPAGITFSKPRTLASGIDFANSGTLTAGVGQGGMVEADT